MTISLSLFRVKVIEGYYCEDLIYGVKLHGLPDRCESVVIGTEDAKAGLA